MSGPHGYFLLTGHGNSYAVGERPQCAMPEAWKPSYSEEQVAELRAAVAELVAASEALRAEWDRQDNGKFDAMPAKDFFAAEARWRAALAAFGGAQ